MTILKFEDIIAWQKARELTLIVYKSFYNNRDFGFKDQIQRASVSILKEKVIKNLNIFCLLQKVLALK